MKWELIDNCGYYCEISDLDDGKGIRKTTDLLRESIKCMAKEVKNYFQVMKELPFNYGERQIHTVLFPAFKKTAKIVFLEQPIKRKILAKEHNGWLDYWISHRKATYLVEIKHSFFSVKTKNLTEKSKSKWEKGIEQIQSITEKEAKELAHGDNDEIFRVLMMIIPFRNHSSDITKLTRVEKEDIFTIFSEDVIEELPKKPNWAAIWYLDDEINIEKYEKEKWFEYFPALSILCYIEPI